MFGDKSKSKTSATSAGNSSFSANNILEGTSIVGQVSSNGDIRIDGKLDGTLNCKEKVVIGKSGVIVGDINCKNARIEGKVSGKVIVAELLVLTNSSDVDGHITTSKIVVDEGAMINAPINMGGKAHPINKEMKANNAAQKAG